jgi:solute carrier family 36 (proton-coupled amino acid transporter)
MTLVLEASMADRSRFRPVLVQAIAGVTVVYICFGACGYLAYGDATKDIITLNLPSTWSAAAVKVKKTRSFTNVSSNRSTRTAGRPHRPMKRNRSRIKKKRLLFRAGGAVQHRAVDRAALHASRVVVLVALSAVACFVPAFGSFASFVGSTVCALLSFVLPACCFTSASWTGASSSSASRSPRTACMPSCRGTDVPIPTHEFEFLFLARLC